jgi:RimJ/RimL family protein N-acetyltransferase
MQPPDRLRTERLTLRRWSTADAPALHPVLEANVDHLADWIPWAVAAPAPLDALAERLRGYASAFDAAERWLYAIVTPDDEALLGGIGLYPRNETGRVPNADADRVEIGYWLRRDATGFGYATEATRAMVALALAMPHFTTIEIRCDPRNRPSIAIPQRLGFRHARTLVHPSTASSGPSGETMVWELATPGSPPG